MELELIPAQTGNGIKINSSPNRKWNYENVHLTSEGEGHATPT